MRLFLAYLFTGAAIASGTWYMVFHDTASAVVCGVSLVYLTAYTVVEAW